MRKIDLWLKKVATKQGLRRVPISSVSLTGEVLGAEFESSLERDLLLLCAFDDSINWFQSQPLTIHYKGSDGRPRRYTPDLLIHFGTDQKATRRPMLCEVKYREELRESWAEYLPKFRAARRYCKENGMQFRIFDESRIRTPKLANVQFLWRYKFAEDCGAYYDELMGALIKSGPTRMSPVIDQLYSTMQAKGEAVWAWWTMVAQGGIECNLDLPLNRETLFWAPAWRMRIE